MSKRIEIALTAKQTEFDKCLHRVENVLYGGAKGGGKSHGMRLIFLKECLAVPNLKAAIFRKTYPELYGNHITKMLEDFPMLKDFYNAQHKEYRFPNGSILQFRHNQYTKDLSNHQGVEYHWLGIEEAGEWPEDWFWTLKGSNRSSDPKITPRCALTGNPGGEGHKWLKRLFIDRNYRPEVEEGKNFAFVPARVYDNPALMDADPGYISRLKANRNPNLVKAYLEGSWDIQAGQYFDMLTRDVHLIDPFEIPDYWDRGIGFDTGYNHPAAAVFGATDTDGNVFIYREFARSGLRTEEIASEWMTYPDINKVSSIPAGWDCWAKHGGGPSVEEKLSDASDNHLILHKANIDRVSGAAQVRDYLFVGPNGPRLKIFKTCPMLFDTLARMTHDMKNPEDVLKVDAVDGDPYTGDDLYDALRHYLMDRPQISVKPEEEHKRDWFDRADEKAAKGSWTTV